MKIWRHRDIAKVGGAQKFVEAFLRKAKWNYASSHHSMRVRGKICIGFHHKIIICTTWNSTLSKVVKCRRSYMLWNQSCKCCCHQFMFPNLVAELDLVGWPCIRVVSEQGFWDCKAGVGGSKEARCKREPNHWSVEELEYPNANGERAGNRGSFCARKWWSSKQEDVVEGEALLNCCRR